MLGRSFKKAWNHEIRCGVIKQICYNSMKKSQKQLPPKHLGWNFSKFVTSREYLD